MNVRFNSYQITLDSLAIFFKREQCYYKQPFLLDIFEIIREMDFEFVMLQQENSISLNLSLWFNDHISYKQSNTANDTHYSVTSKPEIVGDQQNALYNYEQRFNEKWKEYIELTISMNTDKILPIQSMSKLFSYDYPTNVKVTSFQMKNKKIITIRQNLPLDKTVYKPKPRSVIAKEKMDKVISKLKQRLDRDEAFCYNDCCEC